MSRTTVGGIAAFFLIATLAYQNCAGRGSTFAVPKRTEPYDQVKLAALTSLSEAEKSRLCETPGYYSCTLRLFKPLIQSEQVARETCFATDQEDVCVLANVMTYNTDLALEQCDTCTEQDSLPGGRYNYEESFCFNSSLKSMTGIEDRFDSSDLATAYMAARDACLRLVHQ
jgi:hypothetical protein